jgi:hypothetical protein
MGDDYRAYGVDVDASDDKDVSIGTVLAWVVGIVLAFVLFQGRVQLVAVRRQQRHTDLPGPGRRARPGQLRSRPPRAGVLTRPTGPGDGADGQVPR